MPETAIRDTLSSFLVSKHQRLLDQVLALDAHAPADLLGRGIVICAGGPRYFSCAWVVIHQLREVLHSHLPIEVWYAGAREMDERMLALLHSVDGVQTVDATRVPGYDRIRSCRGWALKPFAIIHSSFREVLMLDADNLPVVDPEFLYRDPHYIETGAIFWPDLEPLPESSQIWEVTRVSYRREPSFESGQLLIDKQRSWKALMLTMHMNENAKFFYTLIWGDKDTFHFAWHLARQPYSMPSAPVRSLVSDDSAMVDHFPMLLQHGFDGRVLFQHRNWPKWTAFGRNVHFDGALYEKECHAFLDQLSRVWSGKMSTLSAPPPKERSMSPSGTAWFHYILVGDSDRPLEFLPDGRIGFGALAKEQRWGMLRNGGNTQLAIVGDTGITCSLAKGDDGIWRGCWQFNELHPVELVRCQEQVQI